MNSELEVIVERILPGGLGLAHHDGRTVMVALAAPGDRARVHVDRVKGNVSFASIREIVEPSTARIDPPCPYFGRCGGCDFQQLNYQAQLDAKVEMIRDCLRRIGRIENIPEFGITAAPNQWRYRVRAQWQYDSMRKRLGYFESGSHRVCDVVECAVLAPELQQTLELLRAQMQQGDLSDDARHFRAIVGDEGVATVDDKGRQGATASDITRAIQGDTYHFSAASFFQANSDLVPQLIEAAIGEARGKQAIELYCGVGLFTLPLARSFERVIGVESHSAAADFARENLSNARLTNAEVADEDVADWLESDSAFTSEDAPDFLLLDPPRTGAESRVISGILRLKPGKISYVSCDPATLARDLRKLIAGGYALTRIKAFDMFPQTHHVETVVHLTS